MMPKSLKENMSNTGQCWISGLHYYITIVQCAQNGKMVNLGRKWKGPKTCKKRLYNHIRVIVYKKWLEKTSSLRNDRILREVKGGHSAKVIVRQNGQSRSEIKKAKNHSTTILQLFYTKDEWKKHPTIEKWQDHERCEKWSFYKDYSKEKWSVWVGN